MEQTSTSTSGNVFDLQMDQQCLSYLLQTAKWNKFLSIVWFVLCGLFIILALFIGTIMSAMNASFEDAPGMEGFGMFGAGMGVFVSAFYLLITAIYLIPNFWRYKFSVQAIRAIYNNDQVMLNSSMNNLRKYSKYWGILTILLIGFYVIIFIIGILNSALTYSPTL